jgi:hypothetical protein
MITSSTNNHSEGGITGGVQVDSNFNHTVDNITEVFQNKGNTTSIEEDEVHK